MQINVLKFLLIFLFIPLIYCSNSSEKDGNKAKRSVNSEISIDEKLIDSSGFQSLSISKNFLLGKFSYRGDTNFIRVPDSLSTKEVFIQKQVYKAFFLMQQEAKKQKVRLRIISGTRNFAEQKGIWERKWGIESQKIKEPVLVAKKILTYSSMPSTSRHHWGTDIDMNSLESNYFKTGKGLIEYKWLQANAGKFGFHQVYSNKSKGRTGYNEEEWHWSYMPLSSKYLEAYNKSISYKDIQGFIGSENAVKVRMIEDYVNGIEAWKSN